MLTRRSFLQRSSLLSLSPLVPAFLAQTAGATEAGDEERILVVIELNGGNDGLNTVIPIADENYAKYRDKLRIDKKEVISLNDSLGLHPAMKGAAELFEDQKLAIIPGVGYPNPSRSHFQSMAIWHSARLDAVDHTGHGWLGRACDHLRTAGSSKPDALFVGNSSIPAAIVGRRNNSIAIGSEKELILADGLAAPAETAPGDDLRAFVHRTIDSSYQAARRFAESSASKSTDHGYPNSGLARRLRLVSRIIRLGADTRIFYVSHGGYDTHSAQRSTHENLLRQFSSSLKAFVADMEKSGLGDRVLVLAFSEFGRRVKENASAGTDHGTAGPVFVAGKSVRPGLLSDYPSLTDLDDGDLKSTVDFRSVYASVLADWLGTDAEGPLGGTFDPLSVV